MKKLRSVLVLIVQARLVILILIFVLLSHVQMIISEGLQIVLQNFKGNQNILHCVLGGYGNTGVEFSNGGYKIIKVFA